MDHFCSSLYIFFFFFKQKTAYEMRISDWSSDVCSSDLTPFRLLELQTDQTARQFSQELQFSGRTMDSRLTWLIGLYYFSEKVRFDNPACFSFVCTAVKTKLDTDSYAAFSQATFAIDPRTNLTAGLRYTNETKRNDPDNFYIDNGFGLPPFAVNNPNPDRSEEHTSELQSLMRISYAVFCLKKKKNIQQQKPQKTKQNNNIITSKNHHYTI